MPGLKYPITIALDAETENERIKKIEKLKKECGGLTDAIRFLIDNYKEKK